MVWLLLLISVSSSLSRARSCARFDFSNRSWNVFISVLVNPLFIRHHLLWLVCCSLCHALLMWSFVLLLSVVLDHILCRFLGNVLFGRHSFF